MPLYAYKAVTPLGAQRSSYRFDPSINALYKSLKKEGALLVDCKESKAERFLSRVRSSTFGGILQRIPRSLLIDFCHHMAQLDQAGVPLDISLQDLALSSSHRGFRSLLHIIYEDVQRGVLLSEALARHPKVFDRVFQKLISTAEQTGTFAPQFRQLESYLRHLETISYQIRKAVRSPLILFGLMVVLIMVMINFVIPNMLMLFTSFGLKDPPLSTRLLLCIAPISAYVPLFLAIFGVGLALACIFPFMRYYLSRFSLKIPLYRPLSLIHFWHVLGVMVGAGVDLLPSLSQAVQVIRNLYLRDKLSSITNEIIAGRGLSESFSRETALVSPVMIRLLKLGEQTGHLKELIPQAAVHYQIQTFQQVKTMISWIEPTLILIMGGFMLWIIWAVIIPFYESFGSLA